MGSSTESLKDPLFKIALLLFHFIKDFFFLVWLDNIGILKGTAMQLFYTLFQARRNLDADLKVWCHINYLTQKQISPFRWHVLMGNSSSFFFFLFQYQYAEVA